jgi:hypothetical protein
MHPHINFKSSLSQLMGVPIFWKLLWCDERRQQAKPQGSHSLTHGWPLLINRPQPYLCMKLLELIHMWSAHWLWLSCVLRAAFRGTQKEEKLGQRWKSVCRCLKGTTWIIFNHSSYRLLCNTKIEVHRIKFCSKGAAIMNMGIPKCFTK